VECELKLADCGSIGRGAPREERLPSMAQIDACVK